MSRIFWLLLAVIKTFLEAILNKGFKHREFRKSVYISVNKQVLPMVRTEIHGLAMPSYHLPILECCIS